MDSRRADLGDTDGDFLEAFDDCAAALIVEKCRFQPAHQWHLRTTGDIVLQTLEALGCLDDATECPRPIKELVLRAHGIIREIVPPERRVGLAAARF